MLITNHQIHVHMVVILKGLLDLNFDYLKLLCFACVNVGGANGAGSK